MNEARTEIGGCAGTAKGPAMLHIPPYPYEGRVSRKAATLSIATSCRTRHDACRKNNLTRIIDGGSDRAFRWRKLLETGAFATVEELAAAEKINPSYVSRVLRLTLLGPDIVEAILDGRQPAAQRTPAQAATVPETYLPIQVPR